MIICWDNLEKLNYHKERAGWYNKHWVFYEVKESCKNCSEPFLSTKVGKGYCSLVCSNTGENHPSFGKKYPEQSIRMKNNNPVKSGKNNHNWKGGIISIVPLYDTYAHQISYCEQVRKSQDKNLEIKCAYCGKWYIPIIQNVRNRINALNGKCSGENRLYCSNNCKQECPVFNKVKYSAEENNTKKYSREVQPELRQLVFERDNYTCQKCGKHQDELDCGLHCHHKEGILWEPLESADIDKSITFCKDCHIKVHKLPDCGYHDMKCKEKP